MSEITFVESFSFHLNKKLMYFIFTSNCDYYRPRTYVRREVMFSQVCVCSRGGPRYRSRWGGVPGPGRGGSQVQVWGVPSIRSGGVPGFSKGKFFRHHIWLDTCSDWEKKFLSRDPPK